MALFKILKGPESALPTVAHEGWAYVTDEGNFYVDMTDDIKDRVKINKNAEYAIKADKDSKNQVIADNYIVDVQLTNHGTAPYYKLKLGNGNIKDSDKDGKADQVLLPVANSSNGGIITTGTQTIAGDKTFTHTVTLSKASALNYTGIEEGSAAGARVVWFAHSSKPGTPVKNDNFTYNPASTAAWTGLDATTPSAYGLLNVDRVNGISKQALQDSSGQVIKETYIKQIEFIHDDAVEEGSLSKPILKYTLGDGATVVKLAIPVATSKAGGILSATSQTIKGKKTFSSQIVANGGIAAKANVSTTKQFVSTVADGTAPFEITSTTVSPNLNADMVDGFHASDELFSSTNAKIDTLPTQHAIWGSLNSLLVASHALIYKGTIDPTNSNTVPNAPSIGSVYIISAEGTFNDVFCEPGDMAIYYADGWDIIQTNIDGAIRIKGGGSLTNVHATDNYIPRFDGTSGRIVQNSKVGIDDNGHVLPDATDKQNLGSTNKKWNAIYGLTFSGLANQATHDDAGAGNVIKTHYIADIIYNASASAPTYSLKQGDGTIRTNKLTIPVATATAAGVITADTANVQTLTGPKVLDSSGSLTIQKQDGFKYSGIKAYADTNTAMYLWFSTVGSSGGTPKYNTGLLFNPKASDATSGNWSDYKTSGNYAVITTDRFNGLALNALKDDSGQTIKNTYIKNVVLVDNATAPYYTLTLGNGSAKDTNASESGPDKVLLPVASANYAGVITTGEQTLTGKKILNASGSLIIHGSNAFSYDGIQEQTAANTALYLWFSEVGSGKGVPKYAKGLSYNPQATVKWSGKESTNTTASVLTVNRIEGLAHNALADDQGLVIKNTYVKTIKFVTTASTNTPNANSKPWLQYTLGNGTSHTYLQLPVADSSAESTDSWVGGIVSLDAQVFSGEKTFSSGAIFSHKKFNYSGIEEATADANRCVWFADSALVGKPCYSNNFKYNPNAGVKWGAYDASNVKTGVLTVPRIEGLARKALEDSQGLIIDDTYIKDVVLHDHASAPYYTLTLGNGADKDTDGTTGSDKVLLPVASTSYAGVITTGEQTLTGKKILNNSGSLTIEGSAGFNFSGIEEGTSAGARPVWFAWLNQNGTPVVNASAFTYDPKGSTKWGKDTANQTTGLLKVARIDGLAKNAVYDQAGLDINATYMKGLKLENNKFTITLGSGTTSTFNLVIPVNPTDTSKYVAGQMWIVTA